MAVAAFVHAYHSTQRLASNGEEQRRGVAEEHNCAMMGHKDELKGGDEYDALTRARRCHHFKPGTRKRLKTRVNRRARKHAKIAVTRAALV